MPRVSLDGVGIEYREAGSGFPLVLAHEFGGSMESWEPQVRFFSRRYRVITYNARGYPPSDVPDDPDAYSQDRAVEDLYQLLGQLGIEQAHVGGISMGGSMAVHFGLRHPQMARSLIVASAGSGSTNPEQFAQVCEERAARFERDGMKGADDYTRGADRIQLLRKDPVGWAEFAELFGRHSPTGAAHTLRGVQVKRGPIFAVEEQLRALPGPDADPGRRRGRALSGAVALPEALHQPLRTSPSSRRAGTRSISRSRRYSTTPCSTSLRQWRLDAGQPAARRTGRSIDGLSPPATARGAGASRPRWPVQRAYAATDGELSSSCFGGGMYQ